jgi:hypothetical protein
MMRKLLALFLLLLSGVAHAARSGNGSDAYLNTADITEFDVTTSYSYSFRYRNSETPGSTNRRALAFSAGAGTNLDFGFSWGNASAAFQKAAYHKATSGYKTAQIATSLSADTWYWIGVIWNGSTVKVYLNGAEDASVAATDLDRTDLHPAMWVFTVQDHTGQFDTGTMEHLSLWPQVALTPNEMAALHSGAHPRAVHAFGLVGYWRLDGDASPEPNDALVTSSTATASYTLGLGNSPAQVKSWPPALLLPQGIR